MHEYIRVARPKPYHHPVAACLEEGSMGLELSCARKHDVFVVDLLAIDHGVTHRM